MSSTYVLYLYTPSLAAAVAAIVVFALLTVAHGYRLITTRMWFTIPFVVGGLFETVGYVGRALGHNNKQSKTAYIMQSLLILVAPALFAATIYMTLGRLIRAVRGESLSLIRVTWLTKIFVCGDVLSFFIQGGGGGIMASDSTKVKLGENIILGGLFFQILIFGFFLVAAVVFHMRMRACVTHQASDPALKWEQMLLVLYTVSAIIMTRNVVRVVEYIGGREGPLLRVEWPIYAFDAVLMAATMLVFWVGYPTMIRLKVVDPEGRTELHSVPKVDMQGAMEDRYSKLRH